MMVNYLLFCLNAITVCLFCFVFPIQMGKLFVVLKKVLVENLILIN